MPAPVVTPRTVRSIVLAHAPRALLLVPLTIAEVAFDGALTLSYKYLVDHALAEGGGRTLVPVIAGLALGLVVMGALSTARDRLYAKDVVRVLDDVRRAAFDRCQRLSMRTASATPSSDLLARFSTDLAGLEGALAAGVSGLLLPALHVLLGAGLLFFVLDWKLALVGTAAWPVVLLGPRLIAPRAAGASYERKTREAALLATIAQSLRAQRFVKAYGLSGKMTEWLDRDMRAHAESATRAGFLSALVERSTVISIYAMQVAVVIAGALMAARGMITLGVFVSFVTIFWNLGWSLVVLGRATPLLVSMSGAARRIDELLAQPADACDVGVETAGRLRESVRFERVAFAHDKERMSLFNVSFEIRRGESVAFVGASGSGKSTVLHLLARFDDPMDGRITFDGDDLRTIAGHALRSSMGFVLQDTFLFDTTVRENIRMGRPGATDAEVEAAARAAEIHDAIMQWPSGYDTVVGEQGGRLSGGQRQRIGIACALLRDPALLVLDEATSALDPKAEAAILRTLERARSGRTTVSVTHRLATAKSADRIFVLEGGRLIEQGTHEELLANGRTYPELWKKQQGFVVADDGASARVTGERLSEVAVLQPLDGVQRASLAGRFSSERVSAGQTIIREGEPGSMFYVVARGTLSVRRPRRDGSLKEIARLSDGDQFGEMALLRDAPRSATVVALTDSILLTLPRAEFLEMLDSSPGMRETVEKVMARRLAELAKSPFATTLQ